MFFLSRIQSVSLQHIVETIKHDVVIESWVTTLVGMFGIPARLRIQHIVTILNEVDRLTIGHTVLVNQVTCRMMNDIIMLNKSGNLRAKNLGAVPV